METRKQNLAIPVIFLPVILFLGRQPHCVRCCSFPLQITNVSDVCNFPRITYIKFKQQL